MKFLFTVDEHAERIDEIRWVELAVPTSSVSMIHVDIP